MSALESRRAVERQPRINFLTDPTTSRDLFGIVRGRCTSCDRCGRYLKDTSAYTVQIGEQGRVHPDNDPSLTDCSRCGCPAGAHEVVQHEHAKELGNDAFAMGDYEAAVRHYSQALQLHPSDATLWSNRAAAYLGKGWYQQALHDADHAISLRPDWPKAWGRKAAAHQQLGQYSQALEAYRRGLQLEPGSVLLRQGLAETQRAEQAQQVKQQAQQRRQQARQQREEAQGVLAGRRAMERRASAHPQAPALPRAIERAALPKAPASSHEQKGEGPLQKPPQHKVPPANGVAVPADASVSASPAPATAPSPAAPAPLAMSSWHSHLQTATEEKQAQHQADMQHLAASWDDLQPSKPGSQKGGADAAAGSTPLEAGATSRRRVGVSSTAASVPSEAGKLGLDSLMSLLGKNGMPSTAPGAVAARRTSSSTTTTSTPRSSKAADAVPDKLLQALEGLVPERSSTSGQTAGSPQLRSSTAVSQTGWQGAAGYVRPAALPPLLPPGLMAQWEQLQRKVQQVMEEVSGLQQLMQGFAEALGQASQPPAAAAAWQGGPVAEVEVGDGAEGEVSSPTSASSWLADEVPDQHNVLPPSSADASSSPPTPDGHIASIGSSEDVEPPSSSGQGRVSPRSLFGREAGLGMGHKPRAVASEEEDYLQVPAEVPLAPAAKGVPSSPSAAAAPAAEASGAPFAGSELGPSAKLSPVGSLEVLSDGWVPVSEAPSSQGGAAELLQGIVGVGSESSLGASDSSGMGMSRRSSSGEGSLGGYGNCMPGSSGKVFGSSETSEMSGGCSPWLSRHTSGVETPYDEPSAAPTASTSAAADPPGGLQSQNSPAVKSQVSAGEDDLGDSSDKPCSEGYGGESSSQGTKHSSEASSPRISSLAPNSMSGGASGVSCEDSSHSDAPPKPSLPPRSPAMGSTGEGLWHQDSDSAGSSSDGSRTPGPEGTAASLGSKDLSDRNESSGSGSSDDEVEVSEDEGDFLRAVEEARRRLAEAQGSAAGGAGSIPAPPTRNNRRAPTTTTTAPSAAVSSSSFPALSRAPPAAKVGSLGLGSLQSLVDGVASKLLSRRRDPQGLVRVACKSCGPSGCPQYAPYSLEQLIADGPPVAAAAAGEGLSARLLASQRLCSRCGCDCGQHETEQEGDLRQMRELRARQRAERQARQRAEQQSGGGSAAGPAAGVKTGGQEDTTAAQARRVAAAAARRQAAEESGEILQTTDSDMLTHARRGKCGGCSGCPAFCIHFRSCDANDPEVMFYCSACGCRAEDHEVNTAWAKEQTRKKQREEAAAQRAKQTHHAQQAGFRQQQAQLFKQEAEAYAALGLPLGADMKSIARAYKRLALQLHPDKQQQQQGAGSKPDQDAAAVAAAAEEFVRVAAAYKLLMEKLG